MAERAVPRLTRLLGIVSHLEEHGEATFQELADHFGVSAAQIEKDIDTLWVSGLPGYGVNDLLDFDPYAKDEGIARLVNSQGVRQVTLGASEAAALLTALGGMVQAGIAPPGAAGLVGKLAGALGTGSPVSVVRRSQPEEELVAALAEAAKSATCVTVDYVDAADRRTQRTIEPHRLVAVDGVGYVECFCRRAGDYRTLRLDRIVHWDPTGESQASAPRGEQEFALAPAYEAVVRADRRGRWAFEDLPGAMLEDDGDGVVARFGVANEAVVAGRILSIGARVRSIEPAQLREAVAARAAAVLEAHA